LTPGSRSIYYPVNAEVIVSFLVVEGSLSVRELLCYALLSFGIKGVPVSTKTAAWEALGSRKDISGAIIDIDTQDVDGSDLIAEMKDKEETRNIPIIVHTVQASKEFVVKMIETGVAGYLLKPFREDTAHAKLAGILDKLQDHNVQRRHIRVKPGPDDVIRVHFRLPSISQLISGKIVDISLGGIAMELFNPPDGKAFPVGGRIGKLQFALGPRELSPSALIVMFKGNLLAVRFETLNPQDKTILQRYIFKRISS
jgi:CheY-like chemotaxis protein